MESVVGIFVVIGILAVGYMTIKLGKVSFLGDNSYPLYARFTTVSGLRVGSPVEMLGIDVGKIERLSVDQDRQMALVELRISKGIKVFDDASAAIRTSGLIGDRFIKLDPGGSGDIMKPGGMITETTAPPDIEDLISKYAFGDLKKNDKTEIK
jgi:phospholipid/cholesterol/gamma-HCH transport system substrate-binding protein